jgi:hypothetical protein
MTLGQFSALNGNACMILLALVYQNKLNVSDSVILCLLSRKINLPLQVEIQLAQESNDLHYHQSQLDRTAKTVGI